MSALKIVLLAIDVANRQRDDAGKVMVQIRESCGGAQEQMEQLESYAADTEAKWATGSHGVACAETIRHYYQFMGRLHHAIVLQRDTVDGLQRELTDAKQLLLDAEIRIAGLNRLLKKKRSGIERLQAGREQKQLDEFAAMQHRRLRADTLETT